MSSVLFLQVLTYISITAFVALSLIKIIKYASMPVHLRWELYPVAHEKARPYGGSYYEELDWWSKKRKKTAWGELKYMTRELLLFSLYFRHRKKYWCVVYPFHIGIFLLVSWLVLLFIGAITSFFAEPSVYTNPANVWGSLIYYLTLVTGGLGLILATLGGIGLIVERLVDEDLRLYTTPIHFFNILFFLAILLSGLCAWCFFDPVFATAREFVKSLFTLSPVVNMSLATYISILLACVFIVYVPFTSTMHYIAKYFTYHKVRWDDEPNLKEGNSSIEKKLAAAMNRPITWSASHIKSGGSWGNIALQSDNADETEVE